MSTCGCTVAVLIDVINNVQTLSCYDVLGPVLRLKGTILCISFLYMSDANDQNHETAANDDYHGPRRPLGRHKLIYLWNFLGKSAMAKQKKEG